MPRMNTAFRGDLLRRSRTTVVLPLFLSFLLLLGGCIGTDDGLDTAAEDERAPEEMEGQMEDQPPDPEDSTPQQENETGIWYLEEEVEIWYLEGDGIPFYNFGQVDSETRCDPEEPGQPESYMDIRLPSGGTFLDIRLETDILGSSDPGFGFATFMFRAGDEGPWMNPDGERMDESPAIYTTPPQEETRINVSEPRPGDWTVWVWPHGLVVNQTFTLTLTAQGTSTVMGDLAETNRFGLEC